MSIQRLIMASVATMGVFRRFAQLSDEEKEEVVNKVKEKLNVKEESPEETESEGDTTEDVDESDEESGESDDDEEVDAVPEDEEVDAVPEDEEVDAVPEDEKVDAVPEDEEVSETELESEPSETESPDAESEPDVEPEEKKDEIADIVNNLVDEVETIKKDGHVSPKEVLGLITTMMEMVGLLVEAKPPVRRRRKGSVEREFMIAEKVASSVKRAGYSFAVSPLNLELEGWQPFNVDTIRVLDREVYFDFKDDEGQPHDDGRFRLIDYKRISPVGPLTYYQEQAMKKRREAPVYLVRGQIPVGSSLTALKAISAILGRKFGYKVHEAR